MATAKLGAALAMPAADRSLIAEDRSAEGVLDQVCYSYCSS